MNKKAVLEIKYKLLSPNKHEFSPKYDPGFEWSIKMGNITISKTKLTRYKSWESAYRAAKGAAELLNISLEGV